MSIFTDIFYYALIVPVIPFSLTIQVGIAEDKVQHWTSILLACYSVALLIGSPIAGIYADHTSSRRWPLLIGLVALAASTLLLCLGNSIGLLVLGRILQGFSASIVWSVGCALLVDTMKSAVGVAMGYVGLAMSVGLLVAPVIGGSVYAAVGYYAVYYIAFGVIAVDILLRLLMIEKKVAKQWIKEDETLNSSEEGADQVDIETGTSPITPNLQDYADSIEASGTNDPAQPDRRDKSQLQDTNNEEKRIGTADLPSQDSVASPEKMSIWCASKSLLKSTRLFAALYCLLVESGIM